MSVLSRSVVMTHIMAVITHKCVCRASQDTWRPFVLGLLALALPASAAAAPTGPTTAGPEFVLTVPATATSKPAGATVAARLKLKQ